MVSLSAVILTAVIHLLLRISIFYEQPKNQCSSAPELGSWLFVVSIFMLLLDNEIFPLRYRCIPTICQSLAETFISLVITEFSTLVMWCTLESVTFSFFKYMLSESTSNLYNDMGGDKLVGFIITILAVFILCNVAIATGYYDQLQNQYKSIKKGFSRKVTNVWKPEACPTNVSAPMESHSCYCDDEFSVRRRRRSRQI